MPIQPGLTYEHRFEVTDELSTDVGGSVANRVLATPRMIGRMEYAAMQAVWSELPEGSTCVGFAVNIKHVGSAPVGGACVSTATLTEVRDGRKLHFDVEVVCDGRTIGVGTHERRIIHGGTFDDRNSSAGAL
ncbi:MAG: thioesterase family protein [Thermoleophilaceae bacterium]|nr:thioesterase family protein [Thermoleophilaceae bacterium]